MSQLMLWSSCYKAVIAAFAAAPFAWSVVQWTIQRKAESREREFQVFHKLVRDLVAPHRADGPQGMDAQAAIIFELRQFHRYHEFTQRLLLRLRRQFESMPGSTDLCQEITLR